MPARGGALGEVDNVDTESTSSNKPQVAELCAIAGDSGAWCAQSRGKIGVPDRACARSKVRGRDCRPHGVWRYSG